MGNFYRIKKGFDINLIGQAVPHVVNVKPSETFAIKPSDFQGINLAKSLVKEGDNVKAGSPIFIDKNNNRVIHTAPVSGEIVDLKRGSKRKLEAIIILADQVVEHLPYDKYSVSDITSIDSQKARQQMLQAGVWPNIIQRPFGIIADPDAMPKAIHISMFDSHPLAPDYGLLFNGEASFFRAGIEIMKKITENVPIHLNIHANKEVPGFLGHTNGVEINKFSGKHPVGCVGVQIHHVNPINKGDIVWTINPYGVIQIGKLFLKGIYDTSRIIALTGSEVKIPQYYRTHTGTSIKKIVHDNITDNHIRFVSGNVLTGRNIGKEGYMGYFDHQITVLPEGDRHEFLGWIMPTFKKISFHRAFGLLSFLNRDKAQSMNTNTHGEPRSFVQTGTLDSVLPMDILPTYLLKSIMAEDIDEMEELGIYEVIEEDMALCEFIDLSKHDIQHILRKGIRLLQEA